jgi:DNA-binding NtrC family response regulator
MISSSSWSSPTIDAEGSKKRILIVDDDSEIRKSFELVLEDSGLFQVVTFSDPMLALSNFGPDLYDMVLLDIMMPNVDSFKLYDKMKSIDNNLKVCFITMYDNEETYKALRNRYPTLERECIVSKSVSTGDLIDKLKMQLEDF